MHPETTKSCFASSAFRRRDFKSSFYVLRITLKAFQAIGKPMMTKRTRTYGTAFIILIALISILGFFPRDVNASLLGPKVSTKPQEAVVGQEVTVQAIVTVGGG